MSQIEEKFKLGYMQMIQYIQQIKQQYQSQGMMIDEGELMKALLPQAEKLFSEAEQVVFEVGFAFIACLHAYVFLC